MENNWKTFDEEYPEPYRLIKILVNGEVIETRTYLHPYKHTLMIEDNNLNHYDRGFPPGLLSKSAKWCYNSAPRIY